MKGKALTKARNKLFKEHVSIWIYFPLKHAQLHYFCSGVEAFTPIMVMDYSGP